MNKGEYVFATKYSDGDPGDHWAVGFYSGVRSKGRYGVADAEGNELRHNGFRRIGLITPEVGEWLLSVATELERAPPGAVNLWGMLRIPDSLVLDASNAPPEGENGRG